LNLCGFEVGLDRPLFLIAGPCVVETQAMALDTAGKLKEMTAKLGIGSSTSRATTRPIAVRARAFATWHE